MAGLRRVLLVIWGLISTGVAVVLAAMLLNSNIAERVVEFLDRVFLYNMELVFLDEQGIWMAILFGLLFLVFGLFLLIVALAPKSAPKQLRITTTEGGSVDISLAALENVIKNAIAVDQNMNLGDIKLHVKDSGLYVNLKLMVTGNSSVPQIGNVVRDEVTTQLESFAGITPADINVEVSDIIEEKNPAQKKSNSAIEIKKEESVKEEVGIKEAKKEETVEEVPKADV